MAFENVDYTSLDIPAAPFSDPARIPDFPKNKVPRHVGVIMDGNGRWAQQRGLVRTDGHQAAEPVVFDTIAGAIEAGVAAAHSDFRRGARVGGARVGALGTPRRGGGLLRCRFGNARVLSSCELVGHGRTLPHASDIMAPS